jgi:hypothetical protein
LEGLVGPIAIVVVLFGAAIVAFLKTLLLVLLIGGGAILVCFLLYRLGRSLWVTQWESRGQAYGAMLDLVRCRKRVGRRKPWPSMTPSCTNKLRPPIIPASCPTSSMACFP